MATIQVSTKLALFCAGLALLSIARLPLSAQVVLEDPVTAEIVPMEEAEEVETKTQTDAANLVALPPSVSREEFTSLVLADLPRTISRDIDTVAANLSELTGVAFRPQWFRVDMAKFVTDEPFRKAEIVPKLGLEVVADVASDLVLAHDLTPAALQAEARLFLMHLVQDRQLRCFDGLSGKVNESEVESGWNLMGPAVMIAPANRRIVRRNSGSGQGESQPRTPFKVEEVLMASGSLADRRVLNALGLAEADLLAYPLSKRFPIDSFRLDRYNPEGQSGRRYYQREMFGYNSQSFGTTYVISTQQGLPEKTIPSGPNFSLAIPSFANLLSTMAFAMDGSYYYGQSEEAKKVVVNAPTFTAMLIDGWQQTTAPTEEELQAYTSAIQEAYRKKDKDAFIAACREATLGGLRNLTPTRLRWADASAIQTISDISDTDRPLRDAKRHLVEKAKELLNKVQAKNPGGELPSGPLDWSFVQEHGMNYNEFNRVYSYSQLEFGKPEQPEYAGQVTFGTREVEGLPRERQFKVRINPVSGAVAWLAGEPESEEALALRRKEIRSAAELVMEGIKTASLGTEFSPTWVAEQLRKEESFVAVTIADVDVAKVAPGFVRVTVVDPIGNYHQKCSLNVSTGEVLWETIQEPAREETDNNSSEYDW